MSSPSLRSRAVSAARRRSLWLVAGAVATVAVIAAVVVPALSPDASNDAPVTLVTQPDFRPGASVPCLEHQTEVPNSPYQGGAATQSLPELTFLAYYTAGGRKPFCDGGQATDVDRAWARLYVQLTTDADNVSTILR